MFLDVLSEKNEKLINAAFELHQKGYVMPDSYIIDVDVFLENAGKILREAEKYDIKLYYMTKQIGRNPYLARKLEEMGYAGAVVVDFKEAELFINNGLKIGNVGHLVQIPKSMMRKIVENNPEIITVYSYEKIREVSETALELGKVQDVMLRVIDSNSKIYPGQEAGFEINDIEKSIEKIQKLKGININGLTSFPCFLYDNESKKIKYTENLKTVMKVKNILKEKFNQEVKEINIPSATSIENIKLIAEAGGTHGEPGHALTGTIPMGENGQTIEIPAYVYVSEISHNFRGKGYFYGGGYYRRSNIKNVLVGRNFSESHKIGVNKIEPDNIDYYLEMEKEGIINDTVLSCFRTQMFVTRSTVVLVNGIQNGKIEIIGKYTSLGEKIQ
ncbi:YhfX family PLP-dependent enzyme [Leptotrichia sp. OH3620_COT-345]|uniref:alanine racemase n=1 Tax=Leptotrichia sp. OH3620_COT-345 TaxID=2491048 RepID=UPI000F65524A|nr:alanine racemase [Leptotrichia sp. OH3620_COT-345]RRD40004.1 YhfX family PLP-dependent enzyme [Leptotrichia sp. OH3620_COT-345]